MTCLSPKVVVAGFGCRLGCPAEDLQALLEKALARLEPSTALVALATLDRRHQEPGLQALAKHLGLPLIAYSAAQLAPFEPLLSHRSTQSYRHTGCHGIAESTALAHCHALGNPSPRLVVTRQCSAQATVALAGA